VGTERSRDGKELLGENFAYLISVDTIQDKKSPFYVNGCYFELKEFRRLIKKEYAGFEIAGLLVFKLLARIILVLTNIDPTRVLLVVSCSAGEPLTTLCK
jgi:hypothetical protein